MSTFVAITYPDEQRAAEVMETLGRLQKQYLIDLEDAVYVTKDDKGKLSLHQAHNLEAAGAAGGAMWGALFGLLFFMPLAGMAIGAGTGWLMGKLSDYGIDDKFVKQLSADLHPNTSAIFAVVRRSTPDKVIPEISKFGGHVLQTSLSPEAEERLCAALSGSDTTSTMQSSTAPAMQQSGAETPTTPPTA